MSYTAIASEGGLFPSDLLDRIALGQEEHQQAKDFGVEGRLPDEIQSAFSAVRSHWDSFMRRRERPRESATRITTDWVKLLLETFAFPPLADQTAPILAGSDTYAISHLAGAAIDSPPVHIIAFDKSIDGRDGKRTPHALVQEFLNRSDALWGVVTNGEVLRLLRDSNRVSHPAFIEFNLRAMVEANLYSEFALLYRLAHSSRFPKSATEADSCPLEKYYQAGIEQGGRVRDKLRDGVQEALTTLGTAFLRHSANETLRARLVSGALPEEDYYRQLLRLIYRFLFLMVAEERKLLSPADGNRDDQKVYADYYSINRLRERCERRHPQDHDLRYDDLWQGLGVTFSIFRTDESAAQLGMHALNGELFGPLGCPDLESAECDNGALLDSMFTLSTFMPESTKQNRSPVRQRVNFGDLDVEELGSVYESLLDFRPHVDREERRFELLTGTDRKTTGSYYTPSELVAVLIKSALEPVMAARLEGKRTAAEREAALLGMRVVDPAAGSGHFLLAAARRVARELARVRSGEDEPDPDTYRDAKREVIRHCIYAVDKNPLAVDLCKVALWIEGHSTGMPLSFLDNHVRLGDSLVGVFDLGVLATGIPDGAYTAVEGDEKPVARAIRDQNAKERAGRSLWEAEAPASSDFAREFEAFSGLEDRSAADVQTIGQLYASITGNGTKWWQTKVACDLWTAAFFTPMTAANRDLVPTTAHVRTALSQPKALHGQVMGEAVGRAQALRFFHWPLEFPEVFAAGGFDVVLGNPPWERVKLQEREFFASRDRDIALAANAAARKRMIANLPKTGPALWADFGFAKYAAEGASRFMRLSGRFPLCGRGDINTYAVFAEQSVALISRDGRAGNIVPTGIVTDDTTKQYFASVATTGKLVSVLDVQSGPAFWGDIGHARFKFTLLTVAGESQDKPAEFMFFARTADEVRDSASRFTLAPEDFTLLNPNTRTCPIFRTRRDAEITKAIYRRVPVLIADGPPQRNPWALSFSAMFHMSNDSGLFRTGTELAAEGMRLDGNVFAGPGGERHLPLYEAKMVHHYDHRWATYDTAGTDTRDMTAAEKDGPDALPIPRYWVAESEVASRLTGRWERGWLLGWRDICRSTDERTVIASVIPRVGVGHTNPLLLSLESATRQAALMANLTATVFDYASRQKIGGTHLTYGYLNQLPVLAPEAYVATTPWTGDEKLADWIVPRVLELTFTAWDLAPFAHDIGYDGPPFRWNTERRFQLRCELDAAYFHLYGLPRDDVDYVMDTFPIVRRKDESAHGEYRTKRAILETYDAMARAIAGGPPYVSPLDPPPGDPRAAHQQ
ncbi:hypothetical protein AYO38_06150 [bacterium SCGC AG-212-C10]|nr:hypothetical protein AYO38_06150 [bacterium SCGC AG-212-C10]